MAEAATEAFEAGLAEAISSETGDYTNDNSTVLVNDERLAGQTMHTTNSAIVLLVLIVLLSTITTISTNSTNHTNSTISTNGTNNTTSTSSTNSTNHTNSTNSTNSINSSVGMEYGRGVGISKGWS